MKGIKNIIFDLGGVIINLDNQLTEDAFIALGTKPIKEYFGHGHAASFFKDYEVGALTSQEFVGMIRSQTGINASDEEIIRAWNALLLDFPAERIQLLKELGKSYRIFLFSNTNDLHLQHLNKIYRDTFPGGKSLDDHFEKAYYSHIMKMRKPDTASFQHILKENELKGEETLFVDDALINVEGAEKAGLKGLFLQPGTTILNFQW
jgi:FMN phosphatase YigB (HAD superfamily)